MNSGAGSFQQLPFEFSGANGSAREDIVVGASNAAAVGFVDRWPDWPSPVVVLAGPAGSGKSHLGAVWRERAGALRADCGALAPATAAAATGRPVLLDDVDAEKIDENGLFHLINAVRGARASLLMTARRLPAAWPVCLEDLSSRLRAATVVEIVQPDDALLGTIITKLFADRQVQVEPHVVEFMVRRIERSLATANSVVDRLDRLALERKCRISRALAAEIVTEMDAGQGLLEL